MDTVVHHSSENCTDKECPQCTILCCPDQTPEEYFFGKYPCRAIHLGKMRRVRKPAGFDERMAAKIQKQKEEREKFKAENAEFLAKEEIKQKQFQEYAESCRKQEEEKLLAFKKEQEASREAFRQLCGTDPEKAFMTLYDMMQQLQGSRYPPPPYPSWGQHFKPSYGAYGDSFSS